MNILFLVMNFLLIFVFLNGMVLKNSSFFSSQKNSACHYLTSKLSLESKWEQYKYKSYTKRDLSSKKEPGEKKPSAVKKEIFSSHRLKGNDSSLGKWNLSSVFSSQAADTLFFSELTERLLKELYSHTVFWQTAEKEVPNLAHALVLSFLEKKDEAETLSDLFPEDSRLQSLFYKMLKGSGIYEEKIKKGYPPLADFFVFLPKKKELTSFPHTSYPILRTLFQEATVEKILQLEHKKWEKDQYLHSLTKEELRGICVESFLPVKGKRFQDIEPFLLFSRKTATLEKLSSKEKKVSLSFTLPKKS